MRKYAADNDNLRPDLVGRGRDYVQQATPPPSARPQTGAVIDKSSVNIDSGSLRADYVKFNLKQLLQNVCKSQDVTVPC